MVPTIIENFKNSGNQSESKHRLRPKLSVCLFLQKIKNQVEIASDKT